MERTDRSQMQVRKFDLDERLKRERPSPEECLAMMWQLADDVWAFMGQADAETDVQRRTLRVVRRPG